MTEGSLPEFDETLHGYVRVNLPQDVGLEEAAAFVEDLAADFYSVEVSRPNPKAIVIGGPGPDSIALTIQEIVEAAPLITALAVIAKALNAYAVRFFTLLADDTHEALRRGIVSLSERLRRRRQRRHPEASVTWLVTFQTGNPSQPEPWGMLTFEFEVDSLADFELMIRAVPNIEPRPPDSGVASASYWVWKPDEQRWVELSETDR